MVAGAQASPAAWTLLRPARAQSASRAVRVSSSWFSGSRAVTNTAASTDVSDESPVYTHAVVTESAATAVTAALVRTSTPARITRLRIRATSRVCVVHCDT